ncbi:MAG: diguanylate cyclase [Lachnospiraceae bacterium]|nr:diguanylate cyclase [Lachnospiraceae bacterium]
MADDAAKTKQKHTHAIPLQTIIVVTVTAGFIISVLLMFFMYRTSRSYSEARSSTDDYIASQSLASDLLAGSDALTAHARGFVITGDKEQAEQYYNDTAAQNALDEARAEISTYSMNERIMSQLDNAMQLRERLMATEDYAMRLKVEAMGDDIYEYPEKLQGVQLLPSDMRLSKDEQDEKARSLLFDIDYESAQNEITLRINKGMDVLMSDMLKKHVESSDRLMIVLHHQQVLTVALMCALLALAVIICVMVIIPIRRQINNMSNDLKLNEEGTSELRFLAQTYNRLHEQNQLSTEKLNYEATHDELTGLYNRSAYASRLDSLTKDGVEIALIEVDVDLFKQINDRYGHDIGDAVLKSVADNLKGSFRREEDMVCRIGGDEFAVIMMNTDSAAKDLICDKLEKVAERLKNPDEDIPQATLSIGVAFSDKLIPDKGLFKTADLALYHAKESGRNGVGFSDDKGNVELVSHKTEATTERSTAS